MASASLADIRAYLGIDGATHSEMLDTMRYEAERYVRRRTLIGDLLREEAESERDYLYGFPEQLIEAQLAIIKWMFDRREGDLAGASPPSLTPFISGFERTGADTDGGLRVHVPMEPPTALAPFFYIGWTLQRLDGGGFQMTAEQAAAAEITDAELEQATRYDGYSGIVPMAYVAPGGGAFAYVWVAVARGLGEPPGGSTLNGTRQGTGLQPNNTVWRQEDDGRLDIFIWPVGLNTRIGDGSFTWGLVYS